MQPVPQVLLGVQVHDKPDLETVPLLQEAIQSWEHRLNGTGRILIRYSGTEPLCRVMVEGQDDSLIRHAAEELAGLIRSSIG